MKNKKENIMKEYNLNTSSFISLFDIECGTTEATLKISRTTYRIQIKKNAVHATVSMWDAKASSRYDADANMHSAIVQSKCILFRDFFENIEAIEKAQNIYRKYDYLV